MPAQTIEVSADPGEMEALEPIGDAPLLPAHAVAGLALNMALKYHDINTIQEGALYQQYKLEGRNIEGLHLDMVFHTARAIELHIMTAPSRLADALYEQIAEGLVDELTDAELADLASEADQPQTDLEA